MAQEKRSFGDRVRRSTLARYAMLAFGWIMVGFGIVGIFLPLWPSTIFILLALWAFTNSSQRFHEWLYNHPRFGATARAWNEFGIIPVKAKVLAASMMSVSVGVLVWLADTWILPATVGGMLAIIASWIVTRPSRVSEKLTGEEIMTGQTEARLAELGIILPEPAKAAANYAPFVFSGTTLYVAGQLPMADGKVAVTGKVGEAVTIDQAQDAARLCALNILAQAKAAADGDLDRVRCIKLGGFVNATPDFVDHPQVLNGASNLIGEVLGKRGLHARFAAGAGSLPFDASVEIDAVFEID